MTKKDYIKIAKAINKRWRDKHNEREEYAVISSIIKELGKVFKADNPRFNSEKFRNACIV